jgi:universal stress protein A
MFNRILVAVADDEIVEQVIHTATALAGALSSRLAFVHVISVATAAGAVAPAGVGAAPFATQIIIEGQETAAQALLDRVAGQLPSGTAEAFLRTGVPDGEIAAVAQEWPADLIIIGTHGRGGVGHFFLGSVAEGVLRHAPCPVLTVRLGTMR